MKVNCLFVARRIFTVLFGLFVWLQLNAQEKQEEMKLDFFVGADLNYRDVTWNRVYDILVNLTPGAKWSIGNGWQVGAQALVPVYNDYGSEYGKIRVNVAELSKECNWNKFNLKASAGLFTRDRYGFDVKGMYHISDMLSLEAQAGLTGYCSMADGWQSSTLGRISAVGGANVYVRDYQTQVRLRAGRFLYEDFGFIGEVFRHFNHCSVGMYYKYSNKYEKNNGGFKIVMMIPPYQRSKRKVAFRPKSNFRLTYNLRGDAYGVKMYETDPEENERNGWFDVNANQWER